MRYSRALTGRTQLKHKALLGDDTEGGKKEPMLEDNKANEIAGGQEGAGALQSTTPVDYTKLYETDKTLQGFVHQQNTKAIQTAVTNALQKQQRINDENLSEAERVKEMTPDQRAAYFERKYKDGESARAKDREAEELRVQTGVIFTERGIPEAILSLLDFRGSSKDDIDRHVEVLAGYEYYKKGELDKRVKEAVDVRLKPNEPPKDTGGGAEKNPWAAGQINLTEQGRILRDNPKLAAELKAAAGLK